MADQLIITTKKDNTLEFEADVKGIKDPKMSIQFVIKADSMNLAFAATHKQEQTWSVNIPALDFLEHKNYPYSITVDIDGYHFEPLTGEVSAIGEIKPIVSKPEVKKEDPKKEEPKKVEEEPKKEESKTEEKKVDETVNRTIDAIISREKKRRDPRDVAVRKLLEEVKKKEEPSQLSEVLDDGLNAEEEARNIKDQKVRAILGQIKR